MPTDIAPASSAHATPAGVPGASRPPLATACIVLLALGGLSACADRLVLPEPLKLPPSLRSSSSDSRAPGASTMRVDALPMPAALAPAQSTATAPARPTPDAPSTELATLNLEQVALATFAQLVFADVLKKNVSIDPQVLARKDLVTFRSGSPQTAVQLEAAAILLLKRLTACARL